MRPNKIPLEEQLDIREFIQNYPSRESHYSSSVKTRRKYIESDKNIKTLFREFFDKYTEYEDYVKYQYFLHIFKDCNVGFGSPRSDICCTCEEYNRKIKASEVKKKFIRGKTSQKFLDKHQKEANSFYKLQHEIKTTAKNNPEISVICIDYEKNFFTPVTKVSIEYSKPLDYNHLQ